VVLFTAVLGVAAAIFLAGSGGAGGNPSSADGLSAQPVTARASGPQVVNLGSLPKITAAQRSAVRTARARGPLSPLGKAGLARAKKSASAEAPAIDGPINAAPTPQTPGGALAGFDGMANSATVCAPLGCQPSDHGIASNGTLVVQMVNTAIDVFDTSGTPRPGYPKSLNDFFGVPNVTGNCDPANNNLAFLTDPRVLYDPADQRFIAITLQIEGVFGVNSCPPLSKYWVAVSQGNDPTGNWYVYSIDTHNVMPALTGSADYPGIGFNGEGVFVSGNVFGDDDPFPYMGAFVLGMSKAAMESGGPISPAGFGSFTASKQLLDTVQPVASYGAGAGGPAGELLLGTFNISKRTTGVVVWDFSNVLGGTGPGGQTLSAVVVKTGKYSQPPQADNWDACQDCLETIDTRISATPVYMHGNVYFTHDTAVKVGKLTNANVHWGIVHPVLDQSAACNATGLCSRITTKSALVDEGYLTYSGETDTWFGAIQPDREGNLFIGFDIDTWGNHPPSSAFVARRATAAPGSGFDSGTLLKVAPAPTDNFRWGDYSAIGFDGWGSNGVWFATQYSGASGDWATHIDRLGYTSPAER
jgi:hypothetical protein